MHPIGPIVELALLFGVVLVLAIVLNLCLSPLFQRLGESKNRVANVIRLMVAARISPSVAATASVFVAISVLRVAPLFGVHVAPLTPIAAGWGGGPPRWLEWVAYGIGVVAGIITSAFLFHLVIGKRTPHSQK